MRVTAPAPEDTKSNPAASAYRAGLVRRSFWSAASALTTIVTSVVASVLISRFVDPAEYGKFAVVLAAWGLLAVPLIWCGWLLMRFGPRELETSGTLARTIGARLAFAWPAVAVTVPVAVIVAVVLHWGALLAIVTVAMLGAGLLNDVMQHSATVVQRFRSAAISNLVARGFPVVVIVTATAMSLDFGAKTLLSSTAAGTALGALFLASALRDVLGYAAPDRQLVREMWRSAAPALAGLPATAAISWADPLILSAFVDAAQIGIYQLAYPIVTISAALAASLNSVLTPELVRGRPEDTRQHVARYVADRQPRMALAVGLVCFAGACVAEPILSVVFGSRFEQSARIAAVLCVAAGLQMAAMTLYPVIVATDRQGVAQIKNILQAAVNVGGDVLLGRAYGAMGVAVANVLACAVAGLAFSIPLRRSASVRSRAFVILIAIGGGTALLVNRTGAYAAKGAVALAFVAGAAQCAIGLYRGSRQDVLLPGSE